MMASWESWVWRPEAMTSETPEDMLIAAEERLQTEEDEEIMRAQYAAIREMQTEKLKTFMLQIPEREALAITLHLGLFGFPITPQLEIASALSLRSQQLASYMVRRARERIMYLATRPVVDFVRISPVMSASKLAVVRAVYETASFREARRRLEPGDNGERNRTRDQRVKRAFFRALSKVERRADLADQAAAMRHVIEHLGALSRHEGKGSWR